MPRTKVSRNVTSNKRVRDNTAEIEEISRDFEIESENLIQMLQSEHNKEMREVDSKFEELKNRIPPHILKMKMGDVMMMTDFNELLIDEKMNSLNMTVKETVMKADEGYLTEASNRSRMTSGSDSAPSNNKSIHQSVSIIASMKRVESGRRRSKSTSNMPSTITPGPRTMMSAIKGRTPMAHQLQQLPVPHTSRSKYRTPMSTMTRQKAISVDRIHTITPKVNPFTPLSMLRHARAGEAVFSVSGSPIVAANIIESTANVNIPVADGILSIRPECMDPANVDPQLVHRIDQNTYNHLRTLKTNLDILMSGFSKKFHH